VPEVMLHDEPRRRPSIRHPSAAINARTGSARTSGSNTVVLATLDELVAGSRSAASPREQSRTGHRPCR
jgi:hypothetical protein